MEKQIETGMIMDSTALSEQNYHSKESMEAAIQNDQMKKLEVLAHNWKAAHTQKVREYAKIGRNEPCPCGAVDENGKPKKFKNCCMNKKDWDRKIAVK